jgi:hypothetical protein
MYIACLCSRIECPLAIGVIGANRRGWEARDAGIAKAEAPPREVCGVVALGAFDSGVRERLVQDRAVPVSVRRRAVSKASPERQSSPLHHALKVFEAHPSHVSAFILDPAIRLEDHILQDVVWHVFTQFLCYPP